MRLSKIIHKKYTDLSTKERDWLIKTGELNGCGGKGGKINPPNFFFEADCYRHDYAFLQGGNFRDFLKANFGFYKAMLRDSNRVSLGLVQPLSILNFTLFAIISTLYFISVMIMGWKFFNWK